MTGSASKKARRQQQIVAELAGSPAVRISRLAARFGVSTETVRRDIEELSRRGIIDRTYGGAVTRFIGLQPAVSERGRIAVAERARIGLAAAALVRPGDVLMVDSGSTTTQFARALAATLVGASITVLTNSLAVATALVDIASVRVMVCPGDLNPRERGLYGPDALAYIGRHYADLAFIGASGLTADGPTDVESQACAVKRAMVERAGRGVLLVDSSKFGQKHLEVVCPLARLSEVVTDRAPAGALGEALKRNATALRIAP